MALRRVPAAALLRSGRAAALLPAPLAPRAPLSPFNGNSGSIRFMTDGDRRTRRPFRAYWDSSRGWFRETKQKYSKLNKELKEADEFVQTFFQVGKYLYMITGGVIAGIFFIVDASIEPKINDKCKKLEEKIALESKKSEEFQKGAEREFLDHVLKTQSGLNSIQAEVNDLHKKMLYAKEEDDLHRSQVKKAVNFLKLHGYIVVSTNELTALSSKLNELEIKISSTEDSQATSTAIIKDALADKVPHDYLKEVQTTSTANKNDGPVDNVSEVSLQEVQTTSSTTKKDGMVVRKPDIPPKEATSDASVSQDLPGSTGDS